MATDCYRLALEAPQIARAARPGQFVNIDCGTRRVPHRACDADEAKSVWAGLQPENRVFLRRPFSLYRVDGTTIEIIYRVIGAGTAALAQRQPGDTVDLIGPLGNRFPIPESGSRAILVGGGIGLPPLLFLAESLDEADVATVLLYGVRTADQVIRSAVEAFERLCNPVEIVVESEGQGWVTDRLRETLQAGDRVYAVGPRPMLQAVTDRTADSGNDGFLLLEERMACGIGVCLSCMQMTPDGYKRICMEGPVFNAQEVVWD